MLEAAAAAKTLQETIDSLHGTSIEIGVRMGDAAAGTGGIAPAAQDAAAAVQELAVAWTEEEVAQKAATAAAEAFGREMDQATAEFESFMNDRLHASMMNLENDLFIINHSAEDWAVGLANVARAYREAFAAQDPMAAGLDALRANLEGVDVEATALWDGITRLGPGFVVAAGGAKDAAAAADKAAFSFRLWGTGLRVTGTMLHWIVAGTAEFLAVAVPAAIALGAGFLVAAQGAQNAYNHITALYDTMEAVGPAVGKTAGDVLGLGHSLQAAQNAANPGVYEILGSVINDMKTRFADFANTGLQVVHMFDEFSARITTDLQGSLGGQLHGLLSGMVTDLQEFGQILGNVGHAILNFASAMPGLARVLLAVADAVSHVLLVISSLPPALITTFMAFEEFYRWGGLALRMLIALAGAPAALASWFQGANFIRAFGTALSTVVQYAGIAIQGLGRLVGMFSEAGAAVETFGADVAIGAATMDPMLMAGIAGAVAALVGLVIILGRSKDATEQWIASTNQAVQSASDLNVLGTIGKTLAENSIHLASAQSTLAQGMQHVGTQAGYMTARFGAMNGGVERAAQDVMDLQQQQQQLVSTAATVITNANNLGQAFHTSAVGALALANAAGVNLQVPLAKGSEAMKIAEQQIRNLITGLGAMGAPAGMVGADMTAMGIQSQLAATKVQQLNQAWDAWIGSVTAGASTMSSAQQAVSALGKATFTLHGYGNAAMQGWQAFTSAISSGNSAIDTLRTGMAEGAVSTQRFKSTVQGLVGEMAPFTEGNRTAVEMLSQLAHEAGGPVTSSLKDLEQWAGVAGKTAQDQFAKGMLAASAAMGDMSKVAQNLSAVINSQLDAAMASAIAKTLNISGLTQAYTNDLARYGAQAPQTSAAQNALNNALQRAYAMGQQASAGISHTGSAAAAAGAQMRAAAGDAQALVEWISALHSKTIAVNVVYSVSGAVGGIGGATPGAKIPRAASGTDFAPAGWAWVGERGPELMRLRGGEQILSNPDSMRFMSNVGHHASGAGGPAPAVGVASAGGDSGTLVIQMNGREVARALMPELWKWQTRNSGQVNGILKPS